MTDWTFSNKHNEFHCWGVAIINFIYKDTLELQFEDHYNEPDKSVNRYSSTIAQLGTHSREYNWKHELKIGNEVDGYNDGKVWHSSTILGLKEHINLKGRA